MKFIVNREIKETFWYHCPACRYDFHLEARVVSENFLSENQTPEYCPGCGYKCTDVERLYGPSEDEMRGSITRLLSAIKVAKDTGCPLDMPPTVWQAIQAMQKTEKGEPK